MLKGKVHKPNKSATTTLRRRAYVDQSLPENCNWNNDIPRHSHNNKKKLQYGI